MYTLPQSREKRSYSHSMCQSFMVVAVIVMAAHDCRNRGRLDERLGRKHLADETSPPWEVKSKSQKVLEIARGFAWPSVKNLPRGK